MVAPSASQYRQNVNEESILNDLFTSKDWLNIGLGVIVIPMVLYMSFFFFQLSLDSTGFDTMPPGMGGLLILFISITIYPFTLALELIQDFGFRKVFDLDIMNKPIKILIGFSYVCCFVGYKFTNLYSWWFGVLFLLNPILIRFTLIVLNHFQQVNKAKQ